MEGEELVAEKLYSGAGALAEVQANFAQQALYVLSQTLLSGEENAEESGGA